MNISKRSFVIGAIATVLLFATIVSAFPVAMRHYAIIPKERAITWNGKIFPVPAGWSLRAWPSMTPYFGLVLSDSAKADASGRTNIIFFTDELFQLLEWPKGKHQSNFTWSGSVLVKNEPEDLRINCYCIPTTSFSTGVRRYALHLKIEGQPDEVEFIGPQTDFDDFFSVVTVALRLVGLVKNPADAVHGCFANMRYYLQDKIDLIQDSAKVRRLSDPIFNRPSIGRVRNF